MELKARDLDELREHWGHIRSQIFCEVWCERDTGEVLGILINGDRAWLMFLRESGDPGFHSVSPDYDGPEDALMEFYLSNGQRDEYPVGWTYPTETALCAAEHFFVCGERASFVQWHEA